MLPICVCVVYQMKNYAHKKDNGDTRKSFYFDNIILQMS